MRSSTARFSLSLSSGISALLLTLFFYSGAHAEDDSSTPAKPIIKEAITNSKVKTAADSDTPVKTKNKSNSAKSAAAQHEKDEQEADDLANKIAKKMAELHKENELKNPPVPAMRRSVPKPVVRTAIATNIDSMQSGHDVHWSYDGEGGPLRWGKIDAANAKCDTGERQSPIDIHDGIRVDLEPIQFDYKPVRFNVVDTGHTIQVNLGAGNYISVLGRKYELTQFHFHKPSEERINGKNYDMVAHLVHKDVDGKLIVISVLIEQGKSNSLIQTVWNNMPLEKNETVQPAGTLDLNQLLPVNRQYYTYMGSLTTPPCTEGVLWMVLKEPIEVTQEQISIFSRLYPMNARPIQNTANRLIKESN